MAYSKSPNAELLRAALYGYERQRALIDEKIADIRRELGGAGKSANAGIGMSGQRRRGRPPKAETETTEAAKPKRNMSAAGRKRIIAATRKRWAAWRAAKEAVS